MTIATIATMLMPLAPGSASAQWIFTTETDEFSGNTFVTAAAKGRKQGHLLFASCNRDSLTLLTDLGSEYKNEKSAVILQWKVDSFKGHELPWFHVDATSLAFHEQRNFNISETLILSLVSELAHGNRLTMWARDKGGTLHRADYTLNGSSAVLRRVAEYCGHDLLDEEAMAGSGE